MRRRDFIWLLGGAAVAWPLAARAQHGGKLATIGLLGSGTAAAQSQWTAAFVQRLRELGWTEGRNLVIEYRWAEGHTERLAERTVEGGTLVALELQPCASSVQTGRAGLKDINRAMRTELGCPRRHRPCRRTPEQGDELAPFGVGLRRPEI